MSNRSHLFITSLIVTASLVGFGSAAQAVSLAVESLASLTGTGNHLVVTDINGKNYAVVAADDVLIYELSNSAAPKLVGTYVTTGTGADVVVSSDGQYAYVADGFATEDSTGKFGAPITVVNAHVLVLDISNPASPTLTGDYTSSNGNFAAIEVLDNTVYAADILGGIHIIDVTNPASPAQLGVATDYLGVSDIAVDNTYVYILAPAGSLLAIVDMSTPTNPIFMNGITVDTTANEISLAGSLLLVAEGEAGLNVYEVSNVADPALLSTYNTPGSVQATAGGPTTSYLADGTGGVVALDGSDPTHLTQITTSTAAELEPANDLATAGSFVYVLTDTALYQVALQFDFTVQGSADGKTGNVTLFDGDDEWLTIKAYDSKIGAQAFLGDVNNDGLDEVVTAPIGKSAKPPLKVFDPVTGTLLSSKKLSDSDAKKQFSIGVADYYAPISQAEIIATELITNADGTATLKLYAYFVSSLDNSLKLKAKATADPTPQQFLKEGYKIKFKTDKSFPIIVQAKTSSDVNVQYQLKKKSDGSFALKRKEE